MRMRFVAIFALLGFAALLGGCNTIEGIGKDVKAGGAAVEKAASKSKAY
jgi:predicted small secreted protein